MFLVTIKQILEVPSKYDPQTSARKSETAIHISYRDDVVPKLKHGYEAMNIQN